MPDLIYNVKFNIQDNLQSSAADVDRYENEIKELQQELREMNAQIQAAGTNSANLGKSLKSTSGQIGRTNKQTAIGNQLFFSMSDGIQDATQFSQGFSTGMRAVGNNIGFTAELAGVFVQRTKEMGDGTFTFSNAAKGLSSSFLGVGGVILAINTAVTLLTVFSQKTKQAKNETDALADQLERLASEEMRNLGFETLTLEQELEVLNKIVDDNSVSFDKITAVTGELDLSAQSLTSTLTDATSALEQQAPAVETTVSELTALKRAEEQAASARKAAVLEVIEQRIAEIEATQLVREAISDLGIAPALSEPFDFELNTDEISADIQAFIDEANKQMDEEFAQEQEAMIERAAKARAKQVMDDAKAQMRMDRMVSRNKIRLSEQAAQTAGDVLAAAFGDSKAVQIATALIDTYVSAQKAYASQLIPGDPTSLGRAQIAAGLAVASGLARVATIRSIEPGSSGGGGEDGGSGPSSALTTFGTGYSLPDSRTLTRGDSLDTGRAPIDIATNQMRAPIVNVYNTANVDSKGLYITTQHGRKEYERSTTQ